MEVKEIAVNDLSVTNMTGVNFRFRIVPECRRVILGIANYDTDNYIGDIRIRVDKTPIEIDVYDTLEQKWYRYKLE